MKIKLYQGFAIIALVSAIFTLVGLGFGEDPKEVIPLNLAVGGVCLVMMVLLFYRERRKVARRN